MTGWIKVDKSLTESIRFRRVVRKLRDSSNALRSVTHELAVTIVSGGLMRFWVYADSHIDDANALNMKLDEINELVGIDGFAQALPADWLQVLDSDHVQLPDFVEHNGSSEKQRRDNARRQAEYRHRRDSRNVTRDVTTSNTRNDARPDQTREDQTREEEKKSLSAAPTARDETVSRVFAHWQSVWSHPTAKLDPKRRRVIVEALKLYSEADLCQSISGYRNSPHHTGENDRQTVYDSIELFLRDAKHVDAGLGFYRSPPSRGLSTITQRNVAATEDWEPPETRRAVQ